MYVRTGTPTRHTGPVCLTKNWPWGSYAVHTHKPRRDMYWGSKYYFVVLHVINMWRAESNAGNAIMNHSPILCTLQELLAKFFWLAFQYSACSIVLCHPAVQHLCSKNYLARTCCQVSAWQSATLLPISYKSVQLAPARVEEPVIPLRNPL